MSTEALKRNAELKAKVEELAEALREREQALQVAERERQYLELQIAKLRRMIFGRRSEKTPARDDGLLQLELFEEAKAEVQQEETAEVEQISYERKKQRARRKPLPEDLHREVVEVDVDPELKSCPDCGEEMGCIGHDTSELLEYIPARLYVIEHRLKKYACRDCHSGVVQAQVPPRPIPRGRPGPGLLAYVLVSKFHDHLPLNRLERIFARGGLKIPRQTLCDWTRACGEYAQKVAQALKGEILEHPLVQADETPVTVKDPEVRGKGQTGWLWTYGIPDREVVYDFKQSRSRDGPIEFLGDYSGYLQSDCYSVYTSLARRGAVEHVGCWAHARRHFFDARLELPAFSKKVLALIQQLFRIERYAKKEGLSGADLVACRRELATPVLERIHAALTAKRPGLLPRTATAQAIAYALDNWDALTRYVNVPEARVDNNGAERSLRRVVVGRKNWLYIGHPEAGPRAAAIYSLIESCRRLGIEPYEYLQSILAQLAQHPQRAAELTPRRWLAAQRNGSDNPAE